MPKGFWIGAYLAVALLAGCSRAPEGDNGSPPPPPKTEVVTNPDGTTTTTTTIPTGGK